MLWHCFLKCKLAGDMTSGRQQLLWRKQVTVTGFIDLDSQIEEYHTGVAQLSTRRLSLSLGAKTAFCSDVVATVGHSVNIVSVANVNSVLSVKWINITSFDNCFEQVSLAWKFASISSPAGVYLNILQGVSIALLCKPCTSYDRDVCPSVRLSHAGIEWKRRKLGSRNLHQRIAQGL